MSEPDAHRLFEELEASEEARQNALDEARRIRTSERTLRELRTENAVLKRANGVLEEHLSVRDALRDAVKIPPVPRLPKKLTGDPIVPIAFQSDEHYDEEFTLEQTGGLNEQNPALAEEKVHSYIKRLIRLIEREAIDNPVPYLVAPLLGDMMTGELHAKDERCSRMTPTEAARFAYRLKRIIFDALLKTDIPRIIVPCVDGNHGRTTARRTPGLNQRYSHEHDVYLRLAEHYLEAEPKRIEFYVPESDFVTVEIAPGFRLCITHGDSVKGGSGTGRLAPPLGTAVARWRQAHPANLYGLGHHHQLFDLGSVVVNPCAVGYNPYAASLGLDPGDFPTGAQLFTTLHLGRMKRATTCPVWVR